ncbi:MAG TPA: RES family NAD+ phosphorylase [Ramlibacter sp.]|nr:RES family NAD+ phosphorylase [Ramlibacter sp.]
MTAPWQAAWFGTAAPARRELWRGVEAQHQVATLRLVDDLDEQLLLEQALEASKPPLPPEGTRLHYLLFTPFRYRSPWPSRFRRPDHAGAWYGAEDTATVAAEVAHWRRRFFLDSHGLRDGELVTEHTFFLARFDGVELDLTQPPWAARRDLWRHPHDYGSCHELAATLRREHPQVGAIRYESARRKGGLCGVVFQPEALRLPAPHRQETWVCKTTARRVLLMHGRDLLQFDHEAP